MLKIKRWVLVVAATMGITAYGLPPVSIQLLTTTDVSQPFNELTPPSIDHGQVVFTAMMATGGSGVYVYSQGKIYPVATNETWTPDLQRFFKTFIPDSPQVFGNAVVFGAKDNKGILGIYRWQAAKLTALAQIGGFFDAKHQGVWRELWPPQIASATQVDFLAKTTEPGIKIFEWHEGHFPVALSIGDFDKLSQVSVTPTRVGWIGQRAGQAHAEIDVWNGKNTKLIVNDRVDIPHRSVGYFTRFNELALDASTSEISWIGGGILGQKGVYVFDGKQLLLVADKEIVLPQGISFFKDFSSLSADHGQVIFYGTGDMGQAGIYLYDVFQQTLVKVLTLKDEVSQKTLKQIKLGTHALSGNQIACLLEFTDGTQAIAIIQW